MIAPERAEERPSPQPVLRAVKPVEPSERRLTRLALDIHDGPMQELVALGWSLGDIRTKLVSRVGDPGYLESEFAELHAGLARVEEALRSMTGSLGRPASVTADETAIVAAHVAAFEERCPDVRVQVYTAGEVVLETDSQRIALDRVLREALTNVAKHANASEVTIWLHGGDSSVLVQVEDDGDGFDATDAALADRMGLRGMRERLDMIGGTFDVTSAPGGPTTVSARIERWRPPSS